MKAAVLDLALLDPNPANIRDDLGDLTDLRSSIRAVGILEPLLVKEAAGGRYTVQDGHRRLAASAGTPVTRALCLIREAGDLKTDIVLMVATAMNKALSPIELARAFETLRLQGMQPREIARATGYSERVVGSRLILLNLPDEVQAMTHSGDLGVADATDLARQVVARKPVATTRPKAPAKAKHLAKTHPLAQKAADLCQALGHRATRAVIGSVACGQCWEQAIRDDAIASVTTELPVAA